MKPWLWMLAALAPAPLLEEVLIVPPSGWRPYGFALRQQPAVMQCEFSVRQGPAVRLWLMDRRNLDRFQAARPLEPLAFTAYGHRGSLRQPLGLGDYVLVLDNRLSRREPAEVALRITLDFSAPVVREVPPQRRRLVVAASFLFLVAVSYWFARRLAPRLWARLRE